MNHKSSDSWETQRSILGTPADQQAAEQLSGSDQRLTIPDYEVLGELGRSGMGVVYRVRHLPTGEVLALKTLQQLTPAALYRFKHEFRVVAGLTHPNLITLRELVSDGINWFFTMELLDGVDLRTHIRGTPAAAPQATEEGATSYSPGKETRLRQALGQLAEAITALHTTGVLHRDVKPGNIIVTPTGRVVLLDFGLAGELPPDGLYHSSPGQVCGTVAYMAPEQAAARLCPPLLTGTPSGLCSTNCLQAACLLREAPERYSSTNSGRTPSLRPDSETGCRWILSGYALTWSTAIRHPGLAARTSTACWGRLTGWSYLRGQTAQPRSYNSSAGTNTSVSLRKLLRQSDREWPCALGSMGRQERASQFSPGPSLSVCPRMGL